MEVTYNPWNKRRIVLLVEEWDKYGLIAALAEMYWIASLKNSINTSEVKTFEGIVKLPSTKVAPVLDECGGPAPYLETKNGTIYFLENICPFMSIV